MRSSIILAAGLLAALSDARAHCEPEKKAAVSLR